MIFKHLIFNSRYDKSTIDSRIKNDYVDSYSNFSKLNKTFYKEEDFLLINREMTSDFLSALKNTLDDFNLKKENNNYLIKCDKIIEWRELTKKFGEDLYICFLLKDRNIDDFEWDIIIKGQDDNLDKLFENGASDNHFHLNGSVPIFRLNYIEMVNSNYYFQKINSKNIDNNFRRHCKILYMLRLMFVAKIYQIKNNMKDIEFLTFESDYKIQKNIEKAKELIIELYTIKNKCNYVDYIWGLIYPQKHLFRNSLKEFCGERVLFYLACKYYNKSEFFKKYLPLYIALQHEFRDYFIQRNDSVGFSNFSKFDRKKKLFLQNSIKDNRILYATIMSLEAYKINKIEYRIAPENNNYDNICNLNNYINKLADLHSFKFGFVYHFIKQSDLIRDNIENFKNECRNSSVRKYVFTQSNHLKKLLSSESYSKYIVGIDAANTEYRCRPEVFGEVFRELRFNSVNSIFKKKFQIGITYHVGEDFSDVLDGLRSIDEAINFLDMYPNDRLGHCIALGIDCEKYYRKKYNNIVKTKQDYLDDLVWLYKNINILNYNNDFKDKLIFNIKKEITEIYGEEYSIDDYYDSMLLRGDNPQKVNDTIYKYNNKYHFFNQHATAINNQQAIKIFQRYHYDEKVKYIGDKVKSYIVDSNYINVVSNMQIKLMNKILSRNLIIEVNPTSNFFIGPINKYDELPIFHFNELLPHKNNKNGENIPVIINTDDQGIFNTNLYNEYSILLCAMSTKFSEYSNSKPISIYDAIKYLERIIKNGEKYSFVK